MWRKYVLLLCLASVVNAELIDRLAIVVGQQVITELQLDEELRVTAFLNRQPVIRDAAMRRAAADRLVQQTLVKREMELSHYPLPDGAEVTQYLNGIRRQQGNDASRFTQALAAYRLSEATLKDHLALQLTTLRFIQYRFQPEIEVPDTVIAQRYKSEAADWKKTHNTPPPTLKDSEASIRDTLIEERTDSALNKWLDDIRKRVTIRYLDRSLQ